MIDFAIAGGLFHRDAERGVGRQADAVVVGLDLPVTLSVGEAFDAEYIRQKPAASVRPASRKDPRF